MIICIGSSSKLAKKLSLSDADTLFLGRSNPFNISNWLKGFDLSSGDGINSEIVLLQELLNKSLKFNDPIHLVLLNGVSTETWEVSINVNMIASAMLSEVFAKFTKSNNIFGSITLIGSASSYLGGKLPYSMSKASLIGLMNTLIIQYKPNLRVNMILPGAFEGGMTSDWDMNKKTKIASTTNQQRLASVDEIADSIIFCTQNTYLSGAIINMTGGGVKL